jgi:hypothetical protein
VKMNNQLGLWGRRSGRVLLSAGILGLSLGAAIAADAPADQMGLRLDVDKRQVEVGDSLTLTVEFKQIGSGNGMEIQGPSVPTPENFDLRSTQSSTQIIESNGQLYQVSDTKITLVATKEGQETLGPASLVYQDPKLGKREIQSNGLSVTVTPKTGFSLFGHAAPASAVAPAVTPAQPEDGLRDVKPLLPESFGFFKWLILFLLVLLAVGFFIRLRMRRPSPASSATISEEEGWKDSLRKLFNEDLPSKEFCLKLSIWIRECLEARFSFPAVDYTTGEILRALRQAKASEDVREAAEKCLRVCDRVIYAEGNLGSKDNLKTWASTLAPKAAKKK